MAATTNGIRARSGNIGAPRAWLGRIRRRGAVAAATAVVAASFAQLVAIQPAGAAVIMSQNFDGVVAPALPAGWTSTGQYGPWVTRSTDPVDSAPNAAYMFAPNNISDNHLVSPAFVVPQNGMVTFRHKYNLQAQHDAGVLEIKIGSLDFQDFTEKIPGSFTGGTYATGGYNMFIPDVIQNPVRDRSAWSSSSGGYITTIGYFHPMTVGQTVQLRWRLGTDTEPVSGSWYVDTISVTADQGTSVTVNQAAGQADPAPSAPINFTATFGRPVTGFDAADVSFAGSTAPGTLVAAVTGGPSTYNVAVSGMTGWGTVKPSIPAQVVAGGNLASTSTDNTVTYVPSTVAISQAAGQTDPTTSPTINFGVLFNKAVTGFNGSDIALTGSNAPGTLTAAVTGSGATYNVAVSGMTGPGLIKVSIPANKVDGGNAPSTTTDDNVSYSATTVSITKAAGQADPTATAPINYTVVFGRAVTGFTGSDVSLADSSASGALVAAVTGSGTTYNVAVSGMSGPGLVVARIPTNVVDGGNALSTSVDNSVAFQSVGVTINQMMNGTQHDPSGGPWIDFVAQFSSPVTGFTASDLSFAGTTVPGTLTTNFSGGPTFFYIRVSGMTGPGVMKVSIPANVVDGGNLASTSTDNTVTYSAITATMTPAIGQPNPTVNSTINYRVTFSKPVTGFEASDVQLYQSTTPGNLVAVVTGSGTTYNVAVSGMTGPGEVSAFVQFDCVDQGNSSTGFIRVGYDNNVVTVNKASGQLDPTTVSPVRFSVLFAKPPTGFTVADVSLAGSTAPGSLVASLTGSGVSYAVSVSGMTGPGQIQASIPANVVDGGNAASTSPDNTILYGNVVVSQAAGQVDPTSVSPIRFSVLFNRVVTGFSAADVSFAGSTAPGTLVAAVTGSGTTYTVSVSGMSAPGLVKVSIPANAVDGGNAASVSADNEVGFVNSSVVINQSTGQLDPTASSPVRFTAGFSKPVTGFTASDVSFTGSTAPGVLAASVTGSGTTYSIVVTGMTGPGLVRASIPANVVDLGNSASTSSDNSVTYAFVVVNQASTQADPTAASPVRFTANFYKAVTGFTSADVSLAGSTAPGTLVAAVTGSGGTYTISVSGMTGPGLVKAAIPANVVDGGNLASLSADNTVTFANATVTVNQTNGQGDPVTVSPVRFTALFSKAVTGFTAADVSLAGTTAAGAVATVTGSGTTYTISVAVTGPGVVKAAVLADAVDGGNAPSTSTDNSITYADVTVARSSIQATPTAVSPINFRVFFARSVTGFTAADVSFAGSTAPGAVATVTGSGSSYSVAVSGMTGPGLVRMAIPANAVDGGNAASVSATGANEVVYADVTVARAAGQATPTAVSPVNFTAQFRRPVTGFTAADVSLTGSPAGSVAAVTGSGSTYTIAVSGMTGAGVVKVTIPANVVDGGNAASLSVTGANEVVFSDVTINQAAGQADPTAASPVNFTAQFRRAVTGFTASDVSLTGSPVGSVATVAGSGSTYTVSVSGMTTSGAVRVTIPANMVDGGNAASTSIDNTVTYNKPAPAGDDADAAAEPAATPDEVDVGTETASTEAASTGQAEAPAGEEDGAGPAMQEEIVASAD